MRMDVGLRLGCSLCKLHHCHHCGAAADAMDACATHGLSCRQSEGHHYHHSSLNDIIHRALSAAKILSCLEPAGVFRSDGKRPDGITLVPWKRSKLLVWDVTCTDTFAPSYLARATNESGAVAAMAETRKKGKYATMDSSHSFQPIAVETTGVFGPETMSFISALGRRICQTSGEKKSFSFLLQRLAVAIQRGNSACVVGTLGNNSSPEDFFHVANCCKYIFLLYVLILFCLFVVLFLLVIALYGIICYLFIYSLFIIYCSVYHDIL